MFWGRVKSRQKANNQYSRYKHQTRNGRPGTRPRIGDSGYAVVIPAEAGIQKGVAWWAFDILVCRICPDSLRSYTSFGMPHDIMESAFRISPRFSRIIRGVPYEI